MQWLNFGKRREIAINAAKTKLVNEIANIINICSVCDGWRMNPMNKELSILIQSNGDQYSRTYDWLLSGDYSDLPTGIEDKLNDAVDGLPYQSIPEEAAKRLAEL